MQIKLIFTPGNVYSAILWNIEVKQTRESKVTLSLGIIAWTQTSLSFRLETRSFVSRYYNANYANIN